MTCTPSSNNVNPPTFPPVTVPGFGVPTSPVQSPLPSFSLPTSLLESLTDLTTQLGALFPSGLFKPNPDFGMKNVLDFIANLLTQLAPFLSFYNFIMSALNMINCIIEVLCAIPNPVAVAEKLIKLFSQCLPQFLSLFPPFALPAMIISLLLLILALILYIIEVITNIINNIVTNLTALGNSVTLGDAQAILSATSKIAALLCSIENVLSIFIALGAITAVIKALAAFAGAVLCSEEDTEGCCPPELCPAFIKNTPEGIIVTTGRMKYYSKISADVETILSLPPAVAALFPIPAIREETWQITELGAASSFPVSLIITPIEGNIFWPFPLTFDETLPLKQAPYTVDLTVTVDPTLFGHTDGLGSRTFTISDCVVVRVPYIGLRSFSGSLDTSFSRGTLNIEGGLVYEADGSSYLINGVQATLNTFIHYDDVAATTIPVVDDSEDFNVSFTWKPNVPALAGYDLTTVGCIPEVSVEKAVQNAVIVAEGISSVLDKLPVTPAGEVVPSSGDFLPNISGTQQCINDAIAAFRQDISIESAAVFQATILACLGDLQTQTTSSLCSTIINSVSQFKSGFTIEPDIQFLTEAIVITVTIRDANGTNIATGIPQECADQIIARLTAEATFGQVSGFTYTSPVFNANLTATTIGSGILKILYDGKVLSEVIITDGVSSIEEQSEGYQFVGVPSAADTTNRRDNTDISESE